MTARQQRRHEERKARKETLKAEKTANAAVPNAGTPDEALDCFAEPDSFVPPTPTRAEINRQNAQHSTGPKTPEGKAVSAMNRFRHGLAGSFAVLDWEDADRYCELLFQLHQEHQPETMTECILVERMTQHQWLSLRALRLQDICFNMDVPVCDQEKQLALYLRYGTTHDRAFHKCLADLLKLRAQKSKEQRGFVSQQRQEAAESRKEELHAARVAVLTSKKRVQEQKTERKASPATASYTFPAAEQPQEASSVCLAPPEIPSRVSSQAA